MPLEAGLIAYAGFAQLAASRGRHRPAEPLPGLPTPSAARIAGIVLLTLSLAAAVARFGAAQGVVAWAGQISVAAALLVLLLSWRPRLALTLGVVALAGALLFLVA